MVQIASPRGNEEEWNRRLTLKYANCKSDRLDWVEACKSDGWPVLQQWDDRFLHEGQFTQISRCIHHPKSVWLPVAECWDTSAVKTYAWNKKNIKPQEQRLIPEIITPITQDNPQTLLWAVSWEQLGKTIRKLISWKYGALWTRHIQNIIFYQHNKTS